MSAVGLPMPHIAEHFDSTGLCRCPCEDCTTRLAKTCVCEDCCCDTMADHGVDIQAQEEAIARYRAAPVRVAPPVMRPSVAITPRRDQPGGEKSGA